MHFLLRVMTLLVITLSFFSLSSWAADGKPASLTLRAALASTLENNPQLVGYKFRAQALDGEQQIAGLKPGLHLTTDLENALGSGEYSGVDSAELTLSLSSVIELGGQRDARMNLATARQQQLESARRVLTMDILAEVTHRFIGLVALQEQLTVQQDAHRLAQKILVSLKQQVQAGRTPEAELLRAQAALARTLIDRQNTAQRFASECMELSTFWGEKKVGFTQVQADLFALAPGFSAAELLARLDKNPDLALLADKVQLRTAELRQAKAGSSTNLEWRAGVRHLQASDDSAVVLSVSVPLASSRRASGAVAAATANQASAHLERDNTYLQLQAELTSLSVAYQQAVNEVAVLRTEVLPLLKQAMRATNEAFSRGRYSYLQLSLAQRELLDAQLAFIKAAARAHSLHTDIERLTGAATDDVDYSQGKNSL